ncbi:MULTISPECIES: tetratricopeptide repeat protein [Delftia]|uniref:Tetratricopeptide repeat protein n=2 Tax=Delftia TaxID=80865 RepID=A0A7T2S3V4_DELAC|nr:MULTISPECIES: hypothetical protein [Delftia]MBB1653084.1 hypothetical protein [Delftia sp. UME58]QPS08379.1 hypothetical protein I6G66_29720 [Delftia acidovorans]
MTFPLLAAVALALQLLAPASALAADDIVFKDSAGRVLRRSDLDKADGRFSWELPSAKPVSQAARDAHALGRAAGHSGDHRAALAHFETASKLAPRWPYPVYDAAFTYLLQKDFDAAYRHYRRVDALAPRGFFTAKTAVHSLRMERDGKLPQGTYLRYLALEWETDRDKARQAALAMTRETPGFAPAWKTVAHLEDDPAKRLALLDSGLKADPDAETRGFLLLDKAVLLRERNQIPEAMVMLGELAVDPRSPLDVEALARHMLAQWARP